MKLRDVINILDAEVVAGEDNLDMEIKTACAADLMSDVLAFVKAGSLLLSGLTNPQVIQTANILDIPAIVLVRNKKPSTETIALANQLKIPLLTTKYLLFESAGRLYAEGMRSQSIDENTRERS
ncbi:MAG: DRTGG domain-containing protein [Smithella sp.]